MSNRKGHEMNPTFSQRNKGERDYKVKRTMKRQHKNELIHIGMSINKPLDCLDATN